MVMFLYIVTLRENGKSYIGWTDDIKYRWQRHKRDAFNGSKTYFHRALKKYGPDAFDWGIVQAFDTEDEAKQAEIFWIAELNTNHCHGGFGFNSTFGGDGSKGHKMTNEARLEQSKRLRSLGEAHPSKREESKLKMRLSQLAKGDKHPSKRADVRAKNSATQRLKGDAHQSKCPKWRARHSAHMKSKGDDHASKRLEVRFKSSRSQSGDKGNKAKLTWERVNMIRTSNKLLRELSEEHGVTIATISNIRNFKTWIPESFINKNRNLIPEYVQEAIT